MLSTMTFRIGEDERWIEALTYEQGAVRLELTRTHPQAFELRLYDNGRIRVFLLVVRDGMLFCTEVERQP